MHSSELDDELSRYDNMKARETVHKLYGLICYFELESLNHAVLKIQEALKSDLIEEARFYKKDLNNLIEETVTQLRELNEVSKT